MPNKTSLFKSTSVVSGMTMVSRTLGFVRDMVMASLFGATAGFDAFLVAFKIPNFMRGLFAEGSFAQAFVPILGEYHHTQSSKETLQFIARTISFLAMILLVITAIAEILAPLIVLLFAPGFLHDPARYQIAIHMLRITFPYLMFISLTACQGAVLNSYGHFGAPAFTPIILNLVLIAAAVGFSSTFKVPEEALAWGILSAGVLQLLFQLPFLLQHRLLVLPKSPFKDPNVKRVLKNLLPALFGVSVMQIGLLITTFFASFLQQGSITWLYYADRLTFFSLGIFGVALATVLLPHLATLHAKNLKEDFRATLDWGLRLTLLISLPATLGLLMMAGPLTTTLFKHGQFTSKDVLMTQQSVMAFALGLPAFMSVKILATAFYARQDIKKPVVIATIALVINIIFNCILIVPWSHIGLAMSTSISAIVNGFLLYLMLLRTRIYKPVPGWNKFLVQLLVANSVMVLLLVWGLPEFSVWQNWPWHQQIIKLMIWLSSSIVIYFTCLWLSGMRLKDLVSPGTVSLVPKKVIIQQ